MGDWFSENAPKPAGEDWFAKNAPAKEQAGAAARFAAGTGKALNPITIAEGLLHTVNPYNWGDIASSLVNAQVNTGKSAVDSFQKGNYGKALSQSINTMIPVMGPVMEDIAVRTGKTGDIAGGLGELAGQGALLFGPKMLPSKSGKIGAGSAQAQDAIAFAQNRGIPLSMADISNNMFVRGAQQVNAATLGGALVSTGKRAKQADAMRRVATELMDETSAAAKSPLEAGRGVQAALESRADKLAGNARFEYGELAQLENLPKNQTKVQVGSQTVQTGVLDAQGNPVKSTVPITQTMAFPVDMKPLKQWASPILDKLRQRYNPADPEAAKIVNQQIKSLQSILDGPDYKPASIAEKDLGAVKALRRNADVETEATMRGAQELDILQNNIDQAVSSDPKAIRALQRGRAEWAAKSEVEEIAKKLKEEPAQAFQQATWAKDAGVDFLKRIEKEVPGQMQQIGRAWLEKTFEKAMAEGEGTFVRGKGLAEDWRNLGKETKMVLFKDPSLIANLDRFFSLAKRIDSPANTSGTAPAMAAGQVLNGGSLMMGGFLPFLAAQAGAAGIAALMHWPKFVAKMNQGLSLPVKSPASAAAIGQLMDMAVQKANEMSQSRRSEPAALAAGTR